MKKETAQTIKASFIVLTAFFGFIKMGMTLYRLYILGEYAEILTLVCILMFVWIFYVYVLFDAKKWCDVNMIDINKNE